MTNLFTIYTDEQVKGMNTEDIVRAVGLWSKERMLDTAEPSKQLLKLYEEAGEIGEAYLTEDKEELKDAFGDTLVVLTVLSTQVFKNKNFSEKYVFYGLHDKLVDIASSKVVNNKLPNTLEELLMMLLESFGNISSVIARNQTGEYSDEETKVLWESVYNSSACIFEMAQHMEVEGGALGSLKYAYNVIKHRKGKLIDGVFVKESDL